MASLGEPLDLSKYRDAEVNADNLREITDTIMSAVRDEVASLRGEPAPAGLLQAAPACTLTSPEHDRRR